MCRQILICLIFFLFFLKVPTCIAEMYMCLVNATAYCMGTKCAWGDRPEIGVIAVSRDLEQKGLDYGTLVYIGEEVYVVKDRMPRQINHIDIYMHSRRKARKFGRQRVRIIWHGSRRSRNSGRRRLHK